MPTLIPDTIACLKAQPGFRYKRHTPKEKDLYKIVEQYWPTFQAQLAQADISLPVFVKREFENYLTCGLLEHGFIRVKCHGCRFGPVVPGA
jgi:hypothetical protein